MRMRSTDSQLIRLLREPQSGSVTVTCRIGTVASTSPVSATVDGVQLTCRQVAGQTLTVGQSCILLVLGVGVKPLLIQTA